jgi:hypothetical protein
MDCSKIYFRKRSEDISLQETGGLLERVMPDAIYTTREMFKRIKDVRFINYEIRGGRILMIRRD